MDMVAQIRDLEVRLAALEAPEDVPLVEPPGHAEWTAEKLAEVDGLLDRIERLNARLDAVEQDFTAFKSRQDPTRHNPFPEHIDIEDA